MERHDHPFIADAGPMAAIVLAAPPIPAFAPVAETVPAPDATGSNSRLPGDIGYLNPRGLTADEIDDAMGDLADTRALILDLRTHPGGKTDALLMGHLSWRPIPMATIRGRADGGVLTRWTGRSTPAPGGPLYPDRPVFVLIAEDSPLAARALAYDLKMVGRAIVISDNDAFVLAWRRALNVSRRM